MHTVEKSPKRTTLAERAYQEIRTRIIDNRLAPGAPLDEEALMTELSIGRTPLREAFKVLASERLIELSPNRGARDERLSRAGPVESTRLAIATVDPGDENLIALLIRFAST